MTDMLVALFAFFLLYHAAVLILPPLLKLSAVARRLSEGQRAGLLLGLSPLFALTGTLIFILPHAIGGVTGAYHAAGDLDAGEPGSPSLLILLTVGLLTVRLLIRLAHELWITLHLGRHRCREAPARLRPLESTLLRWEVHDSPNFSSPFLRGALRPRVYIHRELAARLTELQLRAIYLHEVAHWHRHDNLTAGLYSLMLAPLSFSRRVRQWYRAWRLEGEHACDDHAAGQLGSRHQVAEAIVAVLRWQAGLRTPASGVAFCCLEDLRGRVERLLDDRTAGPARPAPSPSMCWISGGLLLAALSFAVACGLLYPQGGLAVYCMLEHAVGMHCVA